MTDYIPAPKMSEILLEEFIEPYNLSAYRLAQDIHVPVSRIQDILHDRRKITADTSLRLGTGCIYAIKALKDLLLVFLGNADAVIR